MSFFCADSTRVGWQGFLMYVSTTREVENPVKRLARLFHWESNSEMSFTEWSDSASGGATWASAGTRRMSGGFSFALDAQFYQQNPTRILEGKQYVLGLFTDFEFGIVIPTALITRVGWICNVRDGGVVEGDAEFVSNGPVFTISHVEASSVELIKYLALSVNAVGLPGPHPNILNHLFPT